MQPLMEWLMASLLAADYRSTAHLCLYDNRNPYPGIEAEALEGLKHQQPVFSYRSAIACSQPPSHYSWRVIAEHPTLRFYQLEAQD
ncbi:MAG: hypothetical protein HC857_09980 [Synechococcales cyanobacterium RU_4_20]|nr:hypothetical protein [Synechococcales cyanobacterium RU_4_20]